MLWEYFESSCAYCGSLLERDSRTGHLDHLVPATESGSNNIHNHALSCARCNGDEKREESWQFFLEKKAKTPTLLKSRKEKIENWISLGPQKERDKGFNSEVNTIIEEAIENFEQSVTKMRELCAKDT